MDSQADPVLLESSIQEVSREKKKRRTTATERDRGVQNRMVSRVLPGGQGGLLGTPTLSVLGRKRESQLRGRVLWK